MKNLSLFFLLFLVLPLLVTSCGEDEEDMIPVPMFTRADYLGSYSVVEVCPGGQDTYNSSLTAGATSNEIIIANLFNLGDEVRATVNGDRLTIPMQLAPSWREFSGSGTLTDQELKLSFTVTGGSGSIDCTAVLTPQ
ncbi:hypothetical protein [Neolewinella persica]|uniref:hypothetical protein n=1 Tax=Neolewinella persica TaxID=70998 RepID=UPI0003783528|nr:hypothetical protein [Neolewinella persica]